MNESQGRANLFLLELVLNLFLFSVCAVACVTVLVYAGGLSRESRELTRAVGFAQQTAEQYRINGQIAEPELGWSSYIKEHESGFSVEIYHGEKLIYTLEEVAVQ